MKQRQKEFKLLLQETDIGYNATIGQETAFEDVRYKLMRLLINNPNFFIIELSVVIVILILCMKWSSKVCHKIQEEKLPILDKLCTIFEDTTSIGSNAHPSVNDPSDDEEEDNELSKSSNKKRDYLDEYDDNNRNGSRSFEKHKKRSSSSQLLLAWGQYSETSKKNDGIDGKSSDIFNPYISWLHKY